MSSRASAIDRLNLGLTLLVGTLFAASWVRGGVPDAIEVAVSLFLVAYLALGAYLPVKDRVPYYESLFGLPLLVYGAHEVATTGTSSVGVVFVLAGGALLASIPYKAVVADEPTGT